MCVEDLIEAVEEVENKVEVEVEDWIESSTVVEVLMMEEDEEGREEDEEGRGEEEEEEGRGEEVGEDGRSPDDSSPISPTMQKTRK